MDEEYLKAFYEKRVFPNAPNSTFDTWLEDIRDDETYHRAMFDKHVAPKSPDATYERWHSDIFGSEKKKDDQGVSVGGSEGSIQESEGSREEADEDYVPRFQDESLGRSRYAQAGEAGLLPMIEKYEKDAERVEAEIAELEKKKIDELIQHTRNPTPRLLQPREAVNRAISVRRAISAKQEELELIQREKQRLNHKKTEIDAQYGAEMLGEGRSAKTMIEASDKERNLEAIRGDFFSRSVDRITGRSSDATVRRRAKAELEAFVNQEISESSKRVVAMSKAFEDSAEQMSEEYADAQKQLGDAYTAGKISRDEYERLFEAQNKDFESRFNAIHEDYENYAAQREDYLKALEELAIINQLDDQTWFENEVKSFTNEWIKTPQEIAGLIKFAGAASSFMMSAQLAPVTLLQGTDPLDDYNDRLEAYLDFMEPLTGWLSRLSEDNLIRTDQNRSGFVGQTVGQLSKTIPASLVAPVAGIAVSAGMSFNEMYQVSKDSGLDETEAVNLASIYTPLGTALEYAGAKGVMSGMTKRALTKKAVKLAKEEGLTQLGRKGASIEMNKWLIQEVGEDVVKGFVDEGLTEAFQTGTMYSLQGAWNLVEGQERFDLDAKRIVEDMAMSFVYGGLAGGGVAFVGSAARTATGARSLSSMPYAVYKQQVTDPKLAAKMAEYINKSNLSTKEKNTALATMKRDREVFEKVLGLGLDGRAEKRAVELVSRKRTLEDRIEGADKSLAVEYREQISAIDEQLQQLGRSVAKEGKAKEGKATEPTDTEPTDAKPTDTKPTDTEPTDTEQTDAKPTDAKPTDTEQTDTEQTDAEAAQATDTEGVPAKDASGERLATVPVSELSTDPGRFQYKEGTDPETGASERLADVKYLDSKTASEARVTGAMQNISEGMGTAIDVAKVFREDGASEESLKKHGISMKESIANDGMALSKLSDPLFDAVVRGDVPEKVGVSIGRNIANKDVQEQFWAKIKGRRLTQAAIEIMAQDINKAKVKTTVVTDLFGTTKKDQAQYEQRVSIIARVRANINRAKNLLGKTAQSKEFLEKYGSKIDAEVSSGASREAATALAVFDALRNSDKEIVAMIDNAESRVAKGESIAKVASDISRAAIKKIPSLVAKRGDTKTDTGTKADTDTKADQKTPEKSPQKSSQKSPKKTPPPALQSEVESLVGEKSASPQQKSRFNAFAKAWTKAMGVVGKVVTSPKALLKAMDGALLQGDYRMPHAAPVGSDGLSVSIDRLNDLMPDDIYSEMGWSYYGDGDTRMDKKSHNILKFFKGKPNSKVTVYRAVPKGVTKIESGDWVSINRDYAVRHGESYLDGDYDIISQEVEARQVFSRGDSIHEQGVEFLRAPDGTIYGATYINPDTGQREYYINPARLSPETLIHETYHPFDDMMAEAAKSGDAHAKAAIARLDKLAEENGYLDRVKNNPAYADRTAEQQRAEARVQMVGEVGNTKLDKSFYDKLKTAVEDAIKWIAAKFDVSLKDFTTDQIMNLKLDDLVSASLGSARRGEFSAIGQKSQSDAGNISFQKEGNINTLTDEAAKEINKRILDGDNVFDASVAVFDAMRKDGRLKGVNELELKNEVSKKLTVETTAKKFETEPDLKAAEKELSGIKVGLIPEDKKGTYLSARPSDVKMLEEGRRAVDSGEVSPREIMNRIIAGVGGVKNIFISPLEVAALIYHKAKLDAADRDLQRRIAEAESAGDSAKVTQLTILWENILAQIDDFHRTSEITGATQSSSFRLRQYMLENEYSALYQRHYIERATGKPIPAEVMRQLQEYEAEIKKIRERVDELEKKEKEQARELRSLRRKQNDKTTSTDGKAGPTRKTTSTTIGRRVAKRASEKLRSAKWDLTIDELSSLQSSPVPLVKAAWNASIEAAALSMEGLGFTVDLAATAIKAGVNAMKATEWYKGLSDKSKAKAIAALQAQIGDMVISAQKEIDGRVTVDGGIVNVSYSYLSDLVDAGMNTVEKAHAAIKKHIEDLGLDPNGEVTDRAIRDAIGGYQRIMGKTVKQLRADVAKLRSLARLQGELEDVRGRKARETNPRKKRLLSAEEKALKRQIAEAEMEVDLSQEQIDAIWRKAYKATEKRLQNEIEALDLKIERAKQGKPTDKKKPDLSGITKDARIKTLRATRDNLKETLKQLQTSEKDNMKKRVEAAEARIERHIAQMREQMRTGNYAIPPSPKPLRSAKLDRLRQERDEIRKRRDALRDQSPDRKARAAEKRIKALTAKIEKLNKQISGEVALESKKRAKVEKTDRELVMGEIIRDLEKQLKETAQYKAEADKRYNEYTRKRAKEKIKRYKEILDEFERTGTMPEPVPKKARNLEKATKDILREQAKLKTRMDIAREQYIFSQKPLWFKAASTALHAMNIPIGLMASFDFSAVLRQGLPLALANPKQAVKAFRDMMSHGFRHRKAEEFMEDMKDWKYYALAKQSGLWLSEPTAKLSAQEERFMGRFVAKIPHVRISANLYNVYLNSLRMGVFEKFADMNIEGGRSLFWRRGGADITNKADQKMFTDMAKFINNITGRGTWLSESGTGASSSPFINAMFFAPRYMVSRFNIVVNSLTGYATYHPAVRVEALRTVYGYIGAMTAVMQLAILAGFEVEDDPRSSDFGKINIDGIRVDLWAGFIQVARLLSVTAAQSRKNLSGKVVPLNEPGYKSETVMDNWIRFIRSKSSPAMGAVWDWSVREKGKWKEGVFGLEERVHFQNMIGEDMTISDKIIESITPLAFSDIWTIYQNHGLDTAVLMFPAALGGASISDIPARPSKKSRNQLIDAFGDQAIDAATEDFDFDPSEFDIDDFDDLDVE